MASLAKNTIPLIAQFFYHQIRERSWQFFQQYALPTSLEVK
jgi:hypothetical protein